MQPRPMAETSRLLFPSVRFCIASPYKLVFLEIGSQLRCCSCTVFLPPASRWNPLPSAESTNEGVSVLVSEKVSSFIQLENGIVEIAASKQVTSFVSNALKAGPF